MKTWNPALAKLTYIVLYIPVNVYILLYKLVKCGKNSGISNPRRYIHYQTPDSFCFALLLISGILIMPLVLFLNAINIYEDSYIYNIAVTATFFTLLWIANKTDKEFDILGLLVLNKGINTINLIHNIQTTLNFISLEHQLHIPDFIKTNIKTSIIDSTNNKLTPQEIHTYTYSLIDNCLYLNIICGEFHIYRGVLNNYGQNLLKIYEAFQKILIKANYITEEEAEDKIINIKEEIKHAG